ncbi:MAG: glycosyltransferase [Solirubrobacteraceae bacterium]|jgi:glycosyltransferase involved in cell wall biosynthesis
MAPRVSAVIGVYNNAATLQRAIDSLLAQTLAELELIVIDDGSRDDSPQIARAAAAKDRRVRAVALGENVGISRSLNQALALARAPVVAIQDADDYSEPARLERQLAALDADPDLAVVGCRMREVDEQGHELAPRTRFAAGDVRGVLLHFNPIPNTSAAMRRDWVLAAGGYDPRYRYAMEHDLWLRLAEHHGIGALDEVLATRTMGSTNVAARAERAQLAETIRARASALVRRRTLRGAGGMLVPAISYVAPLALKRRRRRQIGQAP